MTLARLVLWAVMARVKTAISIAGSARADTSISREAPMPPKAVPTSMAARVRKKRASASRPTSAMMSAMAAVGRFTATSGTVAAASQVVTRTTYGAARKSGEAVCATRVSLANSLRRSR